MISHTTDQFILQVHTPSQNKTKSKLQIQRIFQNLKFFNWKKKKLTYAHLSKLFDKMCKYKMDPVSIVEQADRRMDKVKPSYPPSTSLYNNGQFLTLFLTASDMCVSKLHSLSFHLLFTWHSAII